ncbi:cytochrome c-type biogenesis protein CcmH [Suttonella sp. R2A3]|uniref:cytochrome c-type biogenesis protein n=1 Tax=Suttonella sp. R2A3 TaxID=2908648 RepID=UPI001F46EC4C|nr:cytochrome c-type biogenesis protein [Suttonella sp. R2A3]UJF24735.1 cytochrome c-type biogenesis protein CcmH [Suttonella sp. R2A3]
MRVWISALVTLCFTALSWASIDAAPEFSTPAQEEQYYELIKDIRCPTCQNNNVAESNAPLARQLRGLIATQIEAGKGNSEINAYLVDRYGDFITYKPPFNPRTWLLWLAPSLVMLIAFLWWFVRRGKATTAATLSAEQREELQTWLDEYRSRS